MTIPPVVRPTLLRWVRAVHTEGGLVLFYPALRRFLGCGIDGQRGGGGGGVMHKQVYTRDDSNSKGKKTCHQCKSTQEMTRTRRDRKPVINAETII